ncbi:hypothetical protein [Salmonella phage SSBI34]|nr:hypothetical protein [Salmonella phage SSBI34]
MINFLMKYKKYLTGMAIAIALFFVFSAYISSVEKKAFDSGFQKANTAWMEKGRQYVDLLDKKYDENKRLNYQLEKATRKDSKVDQDRRSKTAAAQVDFARDPSSSGKTISDKFIDLYNVSLGD